MSAPAGDAPTVKRPGFQPPAEARRDEPGQRAPSEPRRDERLQLRMHDEPDARGRTNTAAIVLGVLLLVASGGFGYCAWLLMKEQQMSADSRRSSHAALQTSQAQIAQSREQIAALEQTKSEQAQQLQRTDTELLEAKAALAAAQARLEGLEAERAELGTQMAEYRKVTQQFRSMIDSGKLAVTFRRGRMIVELPAAVLFASGSAELSPQGSAALKEVATILGNVPGKRFIVAGHTDDVPITKAVTGYSSNWALSAARAVIVTEALLGAGLPPAQLSAAGYGEFDPVASNRDPAGRQKNRRIEIVLEPELKAFPSALDDKFAQKGGNAPDKPEPAAPKAADAQ